MKTKLSLLTTLSVTSIAIIVGSVTWAEATDYRPPATAPAMDGPGFSVCATGNYAAYVVLTESKAKTPTAQPGTCVTFTVDNADATYPIQLVGLDGTTPFVIGEDEIGGEGSEKVTATGTMDSPDWSWSQG